MIPDPVAEIKRIRHELGAEMDFDVHRMFDDLRQREATSGRSYVRRTTRGSRITNRWTRVADLVRVKWSDDWRRPGQLRR